MEYIDSSVVVKWFKREEEHSVEACQLLERISEQDSEFCSSEWLILELIRALVKIDAPKDLLTESGTVLKNMFEIRALNKIAVSSEMVETAKDLIIELNLHAADAVHLASAIKTKSSVLWTEDEHFHKKAVLDYAKEYKLEIRRL